MAEMASEERSYPFEEPEHGDVVRVRFIDTNNAPQQIEGEVVTKLGFSDSYEMEVDAGYTTFKVRKFANHPREAEVEGYGPACEIVVIS